MDRGKKIILFHKKIFSLKNRLALSAGDPSGIGRKIIEKSLKILGPKKNFQFLVWTSIHDKTLKIPEFKTLIFKNSETALKNPFKENQLLQIKHNEGPGAWLIEAGKFCLNKKTSALITGPVSKRLFIKYKAVGQTDLLKKLCGTEQVFMCFRGQFFNCILYTDHIPFKEISINKKKFKEFLKLALKARCFLPLRLQNKPLGVLSLNPHAGEGGLIGREEEQILKPVLKSFSLRDVQGPLPPDSAFLRKNWELYSFFIAIYHDQGLIPFKMIHSHSGFAQSLGLPFLRLGVDHGTGKGLKDKDISCNSFLMALKEALRLIRWASK